MTDDFYDLLEVSSDASRDQIKAGFREQVRTYHPDVNDDERARAQFTALKKAYDVLSDPVERQAYDRLGHEDYVAKRTSGLPSPEVWSADGESESSGGETGEADRTAGTSGSSNASGTAANASGGSSGASGSSRSAAGGSGDGTAGSTGTAAGSAGGAGDTANSGGATANSRAAADAATSGSATGRAAGTAGRAGTGTERSAGATSGTDGGTTSTVGGGPEAAAGTGAFATPSSNPIVRWWNRRNFSLPLLWLSILAYLAGLAHFGVANEAGLRSFVGEVRAAGASIGELSAALTGGRYGIETPLSFVAGFDPVAAPLDPPAWYAALAGLVALALATILLVRLRVYRLTWQRLTINETILLALAVGTATVLLGGPLLAGAALMPLLFGVIIYRTRQLPGWAPSYAYVLAVSAPLLGLAAHAAGYGSLAIDLASFVAVPVAGALGLPLRLTIRKRFGR